MTSRLGGAKGGPAGGRPPNRPSRPCRPAGAYTARLSGQPPRASTPPCHGETPAPSLPRGNGQCRRRRRSREVGFVSLPNPAAEPPHRVMHPPIAARRPPACPVVSSLRPSGAGLCDGEPVRAAGRPDWPGGVISAVRHTVFPPQRPPSRPLPVGAGDSPRAPPSPPAWQGCHGGRGGPEGPACATVLARNRLRSGSHDADASCEMPFPGPPP